MSPLGVTYGHVRLELDSGGEWDLVARRFAGALRGALGDDAVAVEHVGSTAVPELPAKPILDFAVGLRADADTDQVIAALEAAGYIFRGARGV